jgi:hypothetical protein
MSYRDIATSEIDRNSPVTEPLLTALRDNPIGIAQRDSGAPKVQPPSFAVFDSPGSNTFTVPDGVTRLRVTLIAGGGGGSGEDVGGTVQAGNNGADSTINDGSTTYTAEGGAGGGTSSDGAAGGASNGDLNLSGDGRDCSAPYAPHYGAGGRAGQVGYDGGGAGCCVVNIDVAEGDSLSYTVGGGGSADATAINAEDGRNGAVIIEY